MRSGFRPGHFRSELNAKERGADGRELIVIGFGVRLFFGGHLGIRHVLSQG